MSNLRETRILLHVPVSGTIYHNISKGFQRSKNSVKKIFVCVMTFGVASSTKKMKIFIFRRQDQGCQMVYFQNKNTNLGKFWRALHRLENVDIFYGHLE
jgi:hypothetical protein